MKNKEHKIGECFRDCGILLETNKGNCPECFYSENGCDNEEVHGPCCSQDRTDETDVFFKEIKEMKEENQNKEEHFYIWGVPNRGEEVKKLFESKGIEIEYDACLFENPVSIFFIENKEVGFIDKHNLPSLCDLITSNWAELKLPFMPKDKELVWAWNDEDDITRVLGIFNIKGYCLFTLDESKYGYAYDHYELFEGEYPKWAKEALSKLGD